MCYDAGWIKSFLESNKKYLDCIELFDIFIKLGPTGRNNFFNVTKNI